jgi:amino acid transporter
MRIVNFVLAVMFLAFAFLQVNDPDPLLWILIYGIVAVICILAAFEIYSMKFLIAVAVLLVGFSFIYIPGVIDWLATENKSDLFSEEMKESHPYIEESREFLGLMICVAVLVFYIFRARRKRA